MIYSSGRRQDFLLGVYQVFTIISLGNRTIKRGQHTTHLWGKNNESSIPTTFVTFDTSAVGRTPTLKQWLPFKHLFFVVLIMTRQPEVALTRYFGRHFPTSLPKHFEPTNTLNTVVEPMFLKQIDVQNLSSFNDYLHLSVSRTAGSGSSYWHSVTWRSTRRRSLDWAHCTLQERHEPREMTQT